MTYIEAVAEWLVKQPGGLEAMAKQVKLATGVGPEFVHEPAVGKVGGQTMTILQDFDDGEVDALSTAWTNNLKEMAKHHHEEINGVKSPVTIRELRFFPGPPSFCEEEAEGRGDDE